MRFFDEQAMQAYIQILHDLIERLSEKSMICGKLNPLDNLRNCKNTRENEKVETTSVSGETCSNLLAEAPRKQDINVERKKKLLCTGSSSREALSGLVKKIRKLG